MGDSLIQLAWKELEDHSGLQLMLELVADKGQIVLARKRATAMLEVRLRFDPTPPEPPRIEPLLASWGDVQTRNVSLGIDFLANLGATEEWSRPAFEVLPEIVSGGRTEYPFQLNLAALRVPTDAQHIVLRFKVTFPAAYWNRPFTAWADPLMSQARRPVPTWQEAEYKHTPFERPLPLRESVPSAAEAWEVGAVIDKGGERYTLVKALGEGGNGTVWLAEQAFPDGPPRQVAIKALKLEAKDESEKRSRFEKEIGTTARLEHDHIVKVHTWGRYAGQLYVVMQYVPGGSLRDRIGNLPKEGIPGKVYSLDEALVWLEQVAGALDHAHSHGISAHRDVKPENMLLGRMDDDERLYLGDFGLAISPERGDGWTGPSEPPAGTGRYMAPEQWNREKLDHRVDIYALGILAYELLTGHRPFQYAEGNDDDLKVAHCSDALPEDSRIPSEVLHILARATAKLPENRYATAGAFLEALRNWKIDPENLSKRVPEYLDWLTDDIYRRMADKFVTIGGHAQLLQPERRHRRHRGRAQDAWWDQATTTVHADHVRPVSAGSDRPEELAEGPDRKELVKDVRERLLELKRAVLVGEPGSGKTWMLWRLTLDYAERWLDASEEARKTLPVPVLVYLNEFNGMGRAKAPRQFPEFVRDCMDDLDPETWERTILLGPYAEQLRREDRLVVLCDALNEMPQTGPALKLNKDQAPRSLLPEVKTYLSTTGRFIVSCRLRDYGSHLNDLGEDGRGLEQVILRDLEPPAICELVTKRLGVEAGEKLWKEMRGSEELLTFWNMVCERSLEDRFWEPKTDWPIELWVKERRAWATMQADRRRLMALCCNPFTADLLCRTYASRGAKALQGSRHTLFEHVTADMLRSERERVLGVGGVFPAYEAIEQALVAVASALQERGVTVIGNADALVAIDTPDAQALLGAATGAGILMSLGEGFRFAHQLFQEYYAVRILSAAMGNPDRPNHRRAAGFFPEVWWDAGQWRETLVILGEFLGGARGANQAARWLAAYSPDVAWDVIERNGAGLTLDDVEEETRAALIAGANSRATEPDPRGRAAAYRVLGRLGADERPGIGLPRGGPGEDRAYWVEIPAGPFLMGSDKEKDSQAYDDELPQREFTLPTYWIARYPVTVAQYAAFVDDPGGGYAVDRYWTADGLNWRGEKRQPEAYWNDPRWHISNHPVVGVTWYEAVAFCKWLTEKVGCEVRLPNEAEWEKAARGTDGRGYPWGDEFDPTKANTSEEPRIGRTSAVGIYVIENAPYGLRDMSGNVWEWCATKWGWKYKDGLEAMIPFNDLDGTDGRVLRGGSWNGNRRSARGANRSRNVPDLRYGYKGIRVCASAPT